MLLLFLQMFFSPFFNGFCWFKVFHVGLTEVSSSWVRVLFSLMVHKKHIQPFAL